MWLHLTGPSGRRWWMYSLMAKRAQVAPVKRNKGCGILLIVYWILQRNSGCGWYTVKMVSPWRMPWKCFVGAWRWGKQWGSGWRQWCRQALYSTLQSEPEHLRLGSGWYTEQPRIQLQKKKGWMRNCGPERRCRQPSKTNNKSASVMFASHTRY